LSGLKLLRRPASAAPMQAIAKMLPVKTSIVQTH
jgi:hypothetical protein